MTKCYFYLESLGVRSSEARVLLGGGLTAIATGVQILLPLPCSMMISSKTDRIVEKASHVFALHQPLISTV